MVKQDAFTLVELLCAVGITGILAAIAIPQYAGYRSLGYDAQAESTLRTVALAEEAYYVDYGVYKDCDHTNCQTFLDNVPHINPQIVLQITSAGDTFTGTASHTRGTGKVVNWPPPF